MEYFNNKNLTKIGKGSFGIVYTNGRYAYKFVVSDDKMKLMRSPVRRGVCLGVPKHLVQVVHLPHQESPE